MRFFIALAVAALALAFAPMQANAQVFNDACQGVSDATLCQSGGRGSRSDLVGRNGIITKVTRIIAMIVGIASVIVIIIGGFKYVLSSGDSNNINSAKNTILYAIIGLVIALVAQVIVVFVLNRL